MDIFRSGSVIMGINFRRWKSDQRIWLVLGVIAVLIFQELDSCRQIGLLTGEKCSAYMLPVLFAGSERTALAVMKMILYVGALLLLCDAPFIYQITPYMVLRSRRNAWWLGECLYIVLTALLYTTFVMIVSMLVILPIITFEPGTWGGVFSNFSFDLSESVLEQVKDYKMHLPQLPVGGRLYPLPGQIYTFFAMWGSICMLGLIQYLVNLASNHSYLGSFVAAFFIFLDPLIAGLGYQDNFQWLLYFSPITWSSVEYQSMLGTRNVLTQEFVAVGYGVLIVVLLILIRQVSKTISIEVRGEI